MDLTGDLYKAEGIYQQDVTKVGTVRWDWDLADVNRYMGYAVVPKQANMEVQVTRQVVLTNNDVQPRVLLDVVVLKSLQGSGGLLNFIAVRIPELP